MQAHEHIWTVLYTGAKHGTKLEGVKDIIRNYASYMTLPDSIRSELNPTEDGKLKAYRPLSHFTDAAWMTFPYGRELKEYDGLVLDEKNIKWHIPENAERKAADGPTDINSFIKHNSGLSTLKEGYFVYAHLSQDMKTDVLFQKNLATPYYEADEKESSETTKLYELDVKEGTAKFNKTGKITTMTEFRNLVTLVSVLTSNKLWSEIKKAYPTLTIDEVAELAKEAYDKDYPETMAKNASVYIKPNKAIQMLIESDQNLEEPVTIAGIQVSSISEIEDKLIEMQAITSKEDIENTVNELIGTVNILDYAKQLNEININRASYDEER
jgi:hypothetical protein